MPLYVVVIEAIQHGLHGGLRDRLPHRGIFRQLGGDLFVNLFSMATLDKPLLSADSKSVTAFTFIALSAGARDMNDTCATLGTVAVDRGPCTSQPTPDRSRFQVEQLAVNAWCAPQKAAVCAYEPADWLG
jgi:hypothetical protein